MKVISPYSGAVAYTAIDCGVPIFADFRGLSTIEATDKYGDFDNGRVSYKIQPLLVDRIQSKFSSQATKQNILFAKPCKNKNQYRLYFADGLIVTLTLPSVGRDYEFTLQKYTNSANLDTLVPVTITTGTSSSGRDLMFGSFQIIPDEGTQITTPNDAEREVYVYQLDRGNSFDTCPIKHFIQINHVALDNPSDFKILRNINLQISGHNAYSAYLKLASEYRDFGSEQVTLLIDPTDKLVTLDNRATYLTKAVEGIGTTIGIEIGGENILPTHNLQAMILKFQSAKTQYGNSPSQSLSQ